MSRFLTAAATMQTLTQAAMEEASREGRREADIEHLFLALVLSEQHAGRVLRGMGIELDGAREAVRAQHAHQLAALGVTAPTGEPQRITFHETDGYEWRDRAMSIVTKASEGAASGDASDVLRGLLAEPSGMIAEILERLGTTREAVRQRLDTNPDTPAPTRPRRGVLTSTIEAFIPASVENVWALVSTAERMPEWNPSIGHVDPGDAATWTARARTTAENGKPIKVRPDYLARGIELLDSTAPTRVTWRLSYPDAAKANRQTLRIELAATDGGTRVTLTSSWPPRLRWWRHLTAWLRPVLIPLAKFFAWMQLVQISSAMSRVFR